LVEAAKEMMCTGKTASFVRYNGTEADVLKSLRKPLGEFYLLMAKEYGVSTRMNGLSATFGNGVTVRHISTEHGTDVKAPNTAYPNFQDKWLLQFRIGNEKVYLEIGVFGEKIDTVKNVNRTALMTKLKDLYFTLSRHMKEAG
jgi:ribosomal protein L10